MLASLHRRSGCPDFKNAALRALLTEAQSEPPNDLAVTLLLLALWPGLDAVRGRLLRFWRGQVADLDGELVGRMSLAIRQADLRRINWIAATLLRNLERDLRRDMMRAAKPLPPELLVNTDISIPDDKALNRDRLAAALNARFPRDGDLLAAVWLDGDTQLQAATTFGLSHEQVRKRVQRARRALSTATDVDLSNDVSQSAIANGFSSSSAPLGAQTMRTAT